MVSAPATLVHWDSAGATVEMPVAGTTVIRIAWSPWLSLVDAQGHRLGETELGGSCLSPQPASRPHRVAWVVLTAAQPGTYRIGAPYSLPRGSSCPS